MTTWIDIKCDGTVVNRVCVKCGQTFGNKIIPPEHIRPPTEAEIIARHTWERKASGDAAVSKP